MAYATTQDLEARYGTEEIDQLLDHDDDGQADSGVADAALADASAEIEAILAARYTVPISATVPLLKGVCCELARYRLWDDSIPEAVQERRDNAVRRLREIARGRGELVDESGQVVADLNEAAAGSAAIDYRKPRERITSDRNLRGFMGE